jgi:predicted Zn-ribbon and HTH transcriptional regulator
MKMMKCESCGFVGVPEVRADDLSHLDRCCRCGSSSLQAVDFGKLSRDISSIMNPKKWWEFWK